MGISYSNLGNINNVFTDNFYGVSFPNCYINLSVMLALAKVKAGKQEPREGAGREWGEWVKHKIVFKQQLIKNIEKEMNVNAIL